MADKTLQTRIKLRTDILKNWEDQDPILLKGEAAVVLLVGATDTEFVGAKLKVGDGEHTFSELKYVGGDDVQVFESTTSIADAVNGKTVNHGDICILKTLIAEDKYEYTAYIYNSTSQAYSESNWKAMDGNYSADNIYFDSDFTLAGDYSSIGNLKSGSTLSAKGKSLSEVMSSILTKQLNPIITQPSVTVILSNAGAYEVGTTISPSYTAKLNLGNYTYDSATGVGVTSWAITDSNGTSQKSTESVNPKSGTLASIVIDDDTNYTISADCGYTAGNYAKDNLGQTTTLKIDAGTASGTSAEITGFRYWFVGGLSEINSSNIRGLNKVKSILSSDTFKASDFSGCTKFIVAIPSSLKKTLKSVTLKNSMNLDITTEFVKQTTTVEGANNSAAVSYDVWVYSPAKIQSEEFNFTIA